MRSDESECLRLRRVSAGPGVFASPVRNREPGRSVHQPADVGMTEAKRHRLAGQRCVTVRLVPKRSKAADRRRPRRRPRPTPGTTSPAGCRPAGRRGWREMYARSVTAPSGCQQDNAKTVRSETATPRLSSSPWIRGAPQRRFSAAMRRMRARTSELMRGLRVGGLSDGSSADEALRDANEGPSPAGRAPTLASIQATAVASRARADGRLRESVDPND